MLYPQQKVYLHLDKLAYQAGETLWYRAYLVDARTHKPDTISKNLIVELVNSFGQISMIQQLKLSRGFSNGDFMLPDTLPEGLYQIKAYTNWMRNFGEAYFYSREVNIWNPEHAINLYRDDKLANKRFKRKSQRKAGKWDVQFFPEGGYLVEGLSSMIGFKAMNELGLGIDVSGDIVNKKNRKVASLNSLHLGMGVFSLTPEPGEKYFAQIRGEDGKKTRFALPEALKTGYVLNVTNPYDSLIRVRVRSNLPDDPVFLVCHIRGQLIHTGEYQISGGNANIEIPLVNVPEGIMHITLFDTKREPRCERLVFVRSDDLLNLDLQYEKNNYGTKEEVKLSLKATDAQGNPVQGNFSLAVSDRDLDNFAGDFQSGIVSNLLLTSDIPGKIEDPDYYFLQNDARTRQALDVLMMTQGWRRFLWNDVINENLIRIDYPIQNGLTVHGGVTREFLKLPLKNLPVTLTVLSEFNDVFTTTTDDQGRFVFDLPDYEDTISIEITARRRNGRKNLVIYIDASDQPETESFYSSYSRDMIVQGTNVIKPLPEPEEDTMQSRTEGIYYQPDFVLEVDENMGTYQNVLDMMKGRIPGVQVSGDNVLIRGTSSFLLSNEPLFLVDNVPVSIDHVLSMNPMDVERIEVLKGPSAAIYGSRGSNGVIAIFTKQGRFLIKGKLDFDMLGYHHPREFYSPRYGTGFDNMIEDFRSCLYWKPEIRTDKEGRAEVSFFNSEKTGRYFIVVEGITDEGRIGSSERSYTVRNSGSGT